jgi:transglutaminase-like putative cysteine protease
LSTRAELADGEPLIIESRQTLPLGSTYTVVSSLTAADPASLRGIDAANEDPPDVLSRYTQLPEALPERVRALARQWVLEANAASRYDMASALEARLREHISYSEEIDQPPAGQDRVDWVLFDGRQGYCDYYASSFVVMARSLGIPARLATGYALGERRGEGRYLMAASNAHAWPEVYFREYGWVEFEPTGGGGIGPIARPQEPGRLSGETLTPEQERAARDVARPAEDMASEIQDEAGGKAPADTPESGASATGVSIPWRLMGGLAALVLIAWLLAWAAWLRPLRGLSPAEGAFARLSRLSGWMGIGRRHSDTPHEFEARLQRSFPQARPEISTIVERFVRERFARRAGGEPSALASAWQRVRAELIRQIGPVTWRRLRGKR